VLNITLKCTIQKCLDLTKEPSKIRWLKEGMRLRLVIKEDAYFGFPITVLKVNYLDDENIELNIELITQKPYNREFILKQDKLYIAVATKKLGRCKIVSCKI